MATLFSVARTRVRCSTLLEYIPRRKETLEEVSISQIRRYNPDIVAIAGARSALSLLHDGQNVTLDGSEKLVLSGNFSFR